MGSARNCTAFVENAARSVGVATAYLVMIGEGTHIIYTEQNRLQLFREVQLSLDEPILPTA